MMIDHSNSLYDKMKKETAYLSYLEETVRRLVKHDCVYVFGAGDRAVCLANYLEKHNVRIGGFLMNKSHLNRGATGNAACQGRVFCYEETLEKAAQPITICLGLSRTILDMCMFNTPAVREVIPISLGVRDDYLISWDTYKKHAQELDWLYARLADERSKKDLLVNLQGRLTGRDIPSCPSGWSDPQYFLSELMKWRSQECLMDGGAFIGDTVEEFLCKKGEAVSKYKIYAWEPDPANFRILQTAYAGNPNVIPLEKGMYSHNGDLCFAADPEQGSREFSGISAKGNMKISVSTIDEIAGTDRVTFIKMDVEGSELEALKGAKQQIVENRPRLAVCLYHKQEDLWTIPAYIESLSSDYQFYLRPHASMPTELTLFCIPS